MDGATVLYQILSANAGVTAIVGSSIETDDALPTTVPLPAVQIEMVSSNDASVVAHGGSVFVRQRIRLRMHSHDAVTRGSLRSALRRAIFANRFPELDGLENIVVELESEGPDGMAPESDVRVGLIDVFVSYNEDR